ncbi:NFX1-type zinc finger-containing protein 1-like [Lutzomyia longipalpis]|uniref:NFX1-type zinc finger-containing protein 1-like n=1 Tax=Lutzomyia longipalpis TaxID=7200 RepID=UPI002483C012|nr:NFX1-type zinc finger-containing protein 1-like [Lutzomyia longipalpis]XP_055679399.1 NFX1-type zinc finger-containing protein 1-like [Lutzomyia longipalpis]
MDTIEPGEVPLEGHKMCGEDDENLKEKKEMSPSNVKENSGKIDHQKDVQSDGAAGDVPTHPANASGSAEAPQDSASQNNVRPLRISKYASRKFSLNELEGILALDTFSAFLSIMSDVLKFENTVLEDGKSHETIIMLILILGKLHKVPLRHHLKELTNRIFGHNATFRNDIMIYVKYAANLEEHNEPNPLPRADQVWASLETFCRYAKRFQESKNCWISCTRGLCRILDGKTHRTLVKMRVKLTKLLEKLENNYFYKGTLYASVQDMKRKPEYVLPKIKNGKFEGIGDFLEYHILHGRAFFLGHLLDGLQGYRELDEEQKNGVLLKDVNGSNIFPCVRIFPHYPPFMEMGKKLFLMDLAPNKRTFGRLPKDVREEVTEEKLRLGNMVPLFLSTSSEFNDIIVAVVPHVPERAREQGFVIIDIVYMENVKESIFNKDLFLLTIPCKFVTKYFTLEFLEKISSATFPMKEFFIDCEESTNIAGNVDFTAELANDASLQLMDQEQLKALEMGLKKRLTIIHGPPGTGKTAVAVKIAECLLVDPSTRILLVSHKNWVLDRMTLKFSSLTDEIVRIGTFIHDPEIEKFTLSPIETDLKYGRVKSNAYNQCVSAKKDFVDAMESFKVRGEEAAEDVRETLRIHREAIDKFDQIYRMWMYFGCQDKRILAMTTTATAKYHDLVELLCPTVVIFDEVSEVSEARIVNSLTEDVQQLILIGDINLQEEHWRECNLEMGAECTKLNLFARMIDNGLNNVRLSMQYRMHPEIADLVRGTLYDDYHDAEVVKSYEPIRGVQQRIFCVTHENLSALPDEEIAFLRKKFPPKDPNGDSLQSKEDFYQNLFCLGLASYLRQQNYQPNEIVLLTMEDENADAMLSLLDHFPLLRDVEVSTKVGFQCSEARIVIFFAGHVKLFNEYVCVCMTRAKEGLYIVNRLKDSEEEEKKNDPAAKEFRAWNEIMEKLKAKGATGSGIPLKCEKHNEEMIASGIEDFLKLNEEGCPKGAAVPKTNPCFDDVQNAD